MIKRALIALMVVSLVGCNEGHHNQRNHSRPIPTWHVTTYQSSDDNGDMLYWYIMTSQQSTNTYYQSSRTPITNFASTSFTRSVGGLPKDVAEKLEEAEKVGEQEVDPANEPPEVAEEVAAAEAEVAAENDGQDTEAMDSDGSSDVGDSGGGDSGGDMGGGDSGGGDSGGGGE